MAWPASIPTFATGIGGVTVSKLNDLRDALKAVGDPWTSYSVTWDAVTTSPALNNGSLIGVYRKAGKTVDYRIQLTIGSTSTMGSGGFTFSLPTTIAGAIAAHTPVGVATLFDTSATTVYVRTACILSTTTVVLRDDSSTAASATVPATWATGDRIIIQGTYETS